MKTKKEGGSYYVASANKASSVTLYMPSLKRCFQTLILLYFTFQGRYLPYWCNYIAWFLAFAAVFLSAFFIMLYSMQWGKQKSEEWLTTFLLSFFESVLCLDPVKVGQQLLSALCLQIIWTFVGEWTYMYFCYLLILWWKVCQLVPRYRTFYVTFYFQSRHVVQAVLPL